MLNMEFQNLNAFGLLYYWYVAYFCVIVSSSLPQILHLPPPPPPPHTHPHKKYLDVIHYCNEVQSDLGYPATSGPAHIRISDLAGYERYMLERSSSVGLNTSYNLFTHCYSICNKLSFI